MSRSLFCTHDSFRHPVCHSYLYYLGNIITMHQDPCASFQSSVARASPTGHVDVTRSNHVQSPSVFTQDHILFTLLYIHTRTYTYERSATLFLSRRLAKARYILIAPRKSL